jgi:hypothetical protein
MLFLSLCFVHPIHPLTSPFLVLTLYPTIPIDVINLHQFIKLWHQFRNNKVDDQQRQQIQQSFDDLYEGILSEKREVGWDNSLPSSYVADGYSLFLSISYDDDDDDEKEENEEDEDDEYTNLCLSASCCFLFIYSSLSIFHLLAFLISLYPYWNPHR